VTELEKPVARRTSVEVRGRRLIATMAPGGLTLRPERTKDKQVVSWDVLWRWMETADYHIKPRTR